MTKKYFGLTKRPYSEIYISKYKNTLSEEQKMAHYKLLKRQIRNARFYCVDEEGNFKFPPALNTLFEMWELKRKLESYIKESEGTKRICYK